MTPLNGWARRWQIPPEAIADLVEAMAPSGQEVHAKGTPESAVQAEVRMLSAAAGWKVWRNNVGAWADKERTRFIRYGLCNDSKAINDKTKSADLIGLRPVVITSAEIGKTIGQFVSIETKRAGWTEGKDKETVAQRRWLTMVAALGGHAIFSTGEIE